MRIYFFKFISTKWSISRITSIHKFFKGQPYSSCHERQSFSFCGDSQTQPTRERPAQGRRQLSGYFHTISLHLHFMIFSLIPSFLFLPFAFLILSLLSSYSLPLSSFFISFINILLCLFSLKNSFLLTRDIDQW